MGKERGGVYVVRGLGGLGEGGRWLALLCGRRGGGGLGIVEGLVAVVKGLVLLWKRRGEGAL